MKEAVFGAPKLSQRIDVKSKYWKSRSCGIVSLKMIMDYWKKPAGGVGLAALIQNGVKIGAHDKRHGWRHKGLVNLAKKYGYQGQNYDWFKNSPQKAFLKLTKKIGVPAIASIHSGLNPKKPGHLVVITGIRGKKIYYNDPDSAKRKHVAKVASIEKFLRGWKRRIIIVRPYK